MRIADWLEASKRDAAAQALHDVPALLDGLAASTMALREADDEYRARTAPPELPQEPRAR